jgi:hypothetical protein
MKTTITQTFTTADDTNPLGIHATISAEKEFGLGWLWEVEKIHYVEVMISDKEGIDITAKVLGNPRALALIESQVLDMEDEIMKALASREDKDEEPSTEPKSLFEQVANMVRMDVKLRYGIDLNGGSKL